MYFILTFQAIFTPWKISKRIKCQHSKLKSHMIDAGMDKRYWCGECDGAWTGTGLAA